VSGCARPAIVFGWLGLLLGCSKKTEELPDERRGAATSADASASASRAPASPVPPRELYLPDGGDLVQNQGRLEAPPLLPFAPSLVTSGCPAEMVSIRGEFCIDRYEASAVDAEERALSPYYPPAYDELVHIYGVFRRVAPKHRAPPLPEPPDFALRDRFEARARSLPAVTPSGYLSGNVARRLCENAGKRLCTPSEWVTACKGQNATKYPYGNQYRDGVCNVFRDSHPAVLLYGDASKNHLDPRLNLTEDEAGPLLRKTGASDQCRSQWGQDAVYDMVGNLDEWVDEPRGAFLGGFYSRSTREGCDARIGVHPPEYFDYSLGTRCCK